MATTTKTVSKTVGADVDILAGEKDVKPIAEGFQFWPSLAKLFAMQTDAEGRLRANSLLTWDDVQTAVVEELKLAAFKKWDDMVAANALDPVNPYPTLADIEAHVDCKITLNHPFHP